MEKDKKLTDNEIIKALECCKSDTSLCNDCPYDKIGECIEKLCADSIDLINRLQAENERLTQFSGILLHNGSELFKEIETVKAEAYKECIEKVKEEINKHSYGVLHKTVINHKLDNLLKELVGEDNG